MKSVKDLHLQCIWWANRAHELKGESEVFKLAKNPLVQDSDVNVFNLDIRSRTCILFYILS